MWTVYCIAATNGQHYVGISSRPDDRLREHNSGKCYATRGRTWATCWRLEFNSKEDAHTVERWLKVGDTKKKRYTVASLTALSSDGSAERNVLRAAEIWLAEVVRKNERGCPPRSI